MAAGAVDPSGSGEEPGVGRRPDRSVHPRQARSEGARARAAGRAAHADPPGVLRPHRPAADAGAGRGVRERPVAGRVREGGRRAARVARTSASGGRGTGSTSSATPRRTATSSTTRSRTPTEYLYYVVRAFNADVPYDRFVVEHIAGDLLPDPRLHPTERFNESRHRHRLLVLPRADARARSTSASTRPTGSTTRSTCSARRSRRLTIACARCHDHKFDADLRRPTTTRSTACSRARAQQVAYLDPGGKIAAAVAQLEAARKIGNDAMSTTPRVMRPVPRYSGRFVRFESFDRGDFGHWSATGHAFGARPTAEGRVGLRGPRPAPGRRPAWRTAACSPRSSAARSGRGRS